MIMMATRAATGTRATQGRSSTMRIEQEQPGDEGRKPAASAIADIADGLADHAAAGDAAEQPGGDIGEAEAGAFPRL